MFRTFLVGIVLGLAATGAGLYYFPAVDQFREHSLIVVHPNQGNTESFHINVPTDRILIGAPGRDNPLPAGLEWPDDLQFAGVRSELFKIRNGKDTVVGIASRLAASNADTGDIIEWVLHLPARGSVYVALQTNPSEDGQRLGRLLSGTREFAKLRGSVSERWVADTSGAEDVGAGRIELLTAFVSTEFEDEAVVE
jgi:hypothetical protein